MADFFEPLKTAFEEFGVKDVIDILIVAVIMYLLIRLLSKTRAMRMVIGLAVILILARVFALFNLTAVTWLLTWVLEASAVLVVVLFQPEIRRALEKLGQGRIFSMSSSATQDGARLVGEFSRAVLNMAKHKIGAILVFERKTGLSDVLESGTILDARVSAEMVENVFYPNTPLHDGAMIVREGRIVAAGCFLPLSDNRQISSELGTRHRAALGISEVSDAYVLVVSEERGTISFAYDGVLERYVDAAGLKEILTELFLPGSEKKKRKEGVDLSAQTREINVTEIAKAGDAAEDGQRKGDGQ